MAKKSKPKAEPVCPERGSCNYEQLAAEVAKLVQDKQAAYGDSFGQSGYVLRAMFPNGISYYQMDQAAAIIRIIDKLFRIATDPGAFGEEPWKDIVGYGLLGLRASRVAAHFDRLAEEAMAEAER